ncbi:MAG: hypothetical protein M9938_11590 [Solirubrobacterales bacterium]|nr:hypothetical protein [Solirubrobacterales bacterium]
MSSPGRKFKGFSRARSRALLAGCAVAAGAVLFTAPVIGDGLNRSPQPTTPRVAATIPATSAQAAQAGAPVEIPEAAGIAAARKAKKPNVRTKVVVKPLTIQSRITTNAIATEEGSGRFVGVRCPAGARAISGGVLSNFINLTVSSSSPNNPQTGKYTPNTWWVSVTNSNTDGKGGTLSWRGVVNCISPARLEKPATTAR